MPLAYFTFVFNYLWLAAPFSIQSKGNSSKWGYIADISDGMQRQISEAECDRTILFAKAYIT
jgi:hypothetical protein